MALHLNLRITGPVFLGSMLLLCVGVGSGWYLHRLQKASAAALARNLQAARLAQELAIGVREIRTRVNRFLLKGGMSELEAIAQIQRELDQYLEQAETLAQSDRERDFIRRMGQSNRQCARRLQELMGGSDRQELASDLQDLRDGILIKEMLPAANEYLSVNQSMVSRASEYNEAVVEWMAFGLLLLGLCGGVAGVLAGYGIARGISTRLVQLSVPVRDVAGKLNAVVGPVTISGGRSFEEMRDVLQTLAERVGEVVARLQQSQQQALRAEQLAAVGQLAAGVAHELRNPLTSLKVLLQSAMERSDWELLSETDLTVLEAEIGRMEQLIQAFLDFARPPRVDRRLVDLRLPVRYTVEIAEARAEQLGTTIQTRLPEQPVAAVVDPGQVRQLLLNLLLNALDAVSRGGEIWVELRSEPGGHGSPGTGNERQASSDGVWAVLEVADSGCGLPAELGDTIFDPFVSTKTTGVGLGLSICRQIAHAHEGSILASPRPGGGAVFTVRLPGASIGQPATAEP